MTALEEVPVEDLRAALESADRKKPAVRLFAAIAYKQGVTQTELSDWLGVERKTIYNWFQRIDGAEDLVSAVSDDPRPGRPRKLGPEAQSALEWILQEPPESVGVEADSWTPSILRDYLASAFDVTYSLPSCRRILNEYRQ